MSSLLRDQSERKKKSSFIYFEYFPPTLSFKNYCQNVYSITVILHAWSIQSKQHVCLWTTDPSMLTFWPESPLSNTLNKNLKHGPRSCLINFMASPTPGCWWLVLTHFVYFNVLCRSCVTLQFIAPHPVDVFILDPLLPLSSERSTTLPWFF